MTKQHFLDTLLPLQPTLQIVAEHLLKSAAEAEDAVQEVYLVLWQRRKELERCVNPQAYAMQTLKNRCLTIMRKQRPTLSLEEFENMADDENSRREAQLTEERAARLDQMMERLPEVQRQAVEMKYIKQMSHDKMQHQLGMTSANVYTTLSRAIANLKTMMNHGR